jgi:hypothetical protein
MTSLPQPTLEGFVMQALVQRVVDQVREAGRGNRVILGNPFNSKTWEYCKAALPEAPTILPLNEVS